MDLRLDGKVALVGGASQGIGAATAKELALLGCQVIIMARNEKKLQQHVEELQALTDREHFYIAVDVADKKALEEKVQQQLKQHDAIEILINNTGGPTEGPISEASAADFDEGFQSHIQTNVLLTRLLLPGMKQKNFGRIINITSTSVKVPIPSLGVSNTIRWAVTAWAKTLSTEVAPFGITVNNVLPGFTDTERLSQLFNVNAKEQAIDEAEYREQMRQTIPAARFGQPEEIANAIAFLATPAAAYINGIALAVDGGRTGCI